MTKIEIALVAAGVAFAGFGIFAIVQSDNEQKAWEQDCLSRGGHVVDSTKTSTVTTVTANRKPGVGIGTTTTHFCLSADGRVLGIK